MSVNVDPEEAEALRALLAEEGAPEEEVVERDFRRPLRFGSSALGDLRRALEACVGEVEARLETLFGTRLPVLLQDVTETSAEGLFDGLEEPLAALRFVVLGQPGWLVWDNRAAIRTVESSLGSSGSGSRARRLSKIECALLRKVLSSLLEPMAGALGLTLEGTSLCQARADLGTWLDGGPAASPHRTAVELELDGPGGRTQLALYLPLASTARAPAAPGALGPPLLLPPHLDAVELDVRVRLGGCRVRLDQLLHLEVGDVLPLDTSQGDPAELLVEDRLFAHGTIGTSRGRFAVVLESFEHQPPQELE